MYPVKGSWLARLAPRYWSTLIRFGSPRVTSSLLDHGSLQPDSLGDVETDADPPKTLRL